MQQAEYDRDGEGPARFIVVMGVCGVGKTTVARLLAVRLGAGFVEADDLHPDENVAQMASGRPLGDEARWPWLDRVCDRALALAGEAGGPPHGTVVVACSALKVRYRDVFRRRLGRVLFLHLVGPADAIRSRLEARADHFMPPALLASQLADLEVPGTETDLVQLPIDRSVETIVEDALSVVGGGAWGARSSPDQGDGH